MHSAKQYFVVFAVVLTIIVVVTAGCTGTTPAASPASTPAAAAISTAPPLSPEVKQQTAFPNLVGVWTTTGAAIGHKKDSGFFIANTTQFTITEQQGQAFTGTKDYSKNGTVNYENISGVFSDDGKKIYIAEHEGGYLFGEIIGPNEIAIVYLQDGNDAAARAFHLTRQQN
jgi:hypothetical protein